MARIGIRQGRRLDVFPRAVPVVDDLVVAVLTGGRAHLLAGTLDAIEKQSGERLQRWTVIALANGADQSTMEVLRARPWVETIPVPGKLLPIGESVSALMEHVQRSGRKFVLHLEDDWCCVSPPERWLDRAAYALEDPVVGQVRLRRVNEKVSRTNMLTQVAIRWKEASDHKRSSNAHFTFNPHLIRAAQIPDLYPCAGELDAQRKFGALGMSVVQLIPGAFFHTGELGSLRQSLGRDHGP